MKIANTGNDFIDFGFINTDDNVYALDTWRSFLDRIEDASDRVTDTYGETVSAVMSNVVSMDSLLDNALHLDIDEDGTINKHYMRGFVDSKISISRGNSYKNMFWVAVKSLM